MDAPSSREIAAAPRAPASRCSSARSPSRSPSCSSRAAATSTGIEHTVLNAKPEHAEREGEIVAEAGPPGAVTIATNMAGRGVDIKLGGNPEHLTAARARASSASSPATPTTTSASPTSCRRSRSASRTTARRSSRPAACSSAAPSATSRAASTTSFAAAPAARATRASRASSSAPRTTSCASSPATGSTRSSTASARPTRRATRSRSRPGCSRKQIEKAQKKVEEQNFLIRKRVLEYDDVMNEQRRVVYAYRDDVLEGRDMGEPAREEIARRHPAALVDEYAARRLRRGLGPRRPVHRARRTSSRSSCRRRTDVDTREPRPRRARRAARRGRRRRSTTARGGARRRADARARALPAAADHRQPLARAPLRHGLPARGHPPARVRPDRADRRLQERGVRRSSPT